MIFPGFHVFPSMMIHSLFFRVRVRVRVTVFPISRVCPTRSLPRYSLGLVADKIACTTD